MVVSLTEWPASSERVAKDSVISRTSFGRGFPCLGFSVNNFAS